jgi:F-type H+-transporting ATPase subunit delta
MFTASDIAKIIEIITAQNHNEEERAEISEEIAQQFPRIGRALKHLIFFDTYQVVITSARELTKEEKAKIENGISQKSGRRHHFTYKIEKKMKAGLIIKIGDLVIDNSIAAKLNQIQEHIVNAALK